MNEILKRRVDIDTSTQWLKNNGFISHPISCKDWELKKVVESLDDGDLIDLGADGSFVLHNAFIKGITGKKVGIDLAEVTGTNKAEGAEYIQGDLMNVPLPDESFDTVVSMSVIEHAVDLFVFANECSRLLRKNGTLIVSFDTWTPKPDTSKTMLYSLDWNILDKNDIEFLIKNMEDNGLFMDGEMDWTTGDAVINPSYCSPAIGVEYSFSILRFVKK